MRKRLAACGLVLALVVGCTKFKQINLFTVPQEMAVGEVFSSEVEAVYPLLGDPRVVWYLNHRGRQLADISQRRELPYFFNVIDTPELNAFAIPGGHIYFNLGMIEAADNESELLGVMAHEIGHVVAKHSMKQLSQQSIVQIVGSIALNQYPNQWAALAANLFGTSTFLKMSRDAEREADAIGFHMMVNAGYHPEGMAGLFGKLLKLRDKEPSLLEKLFLTHPPSQERIDNIHAMIAAQPLPADLKRDTELFTELKAYIIETYYTDSYRRSWAEYLRQKEIEKEEEEEHEDRLPWDKDKKKEKAKAEAARKDGEAESGTPTPAPDSDPGSEAPPEAGAPAPETDSEPVPETVPEDGAPPAATPEPEATPSPAPGASLVSSVEVTHGGN